MTKENKTSTEFSGAISIKTFCEMFEISPATFYREVADGNIITFKIRGKTMISAVEAERWFETKVATAELAKMKRNIT